MNAQAVLSRNHLITNLYKRIDLLEMKVKELTMRMHEEREAIEATWRQHINMLAHREGKRPEKIQVGYGLLSRYRIVAGIKPTQKVVLDGVEVWG